MATIATSSLAVILLITEETERTANFYRQVLGLSGKEPEFGGAGAAKASDSVQLCFSVPNMDEFLQHLRTVKVEPLHAPMPFEHTTFTTLRDPDGRAVRVMTPWG
jgi:predicted enzyme related to lactoylglutathione lyase